MTTPHAALPPDLAAALARHPDLAPAPVRYFPVLGSTNDTAAALAAAGAADATVVIAGRQTAGRGRRGRVWHSPPSVGLYLSVLLRGRQPPVVTLLAGVAVAEAVRETTGVAAEVKWPNDVVVTPAGDGAGARARRKVAGILTEALPRGSGFGDGAVIGIGVNVGVRAFPSELAGRAAAIEALAGRPVDRAALCAGILVRLMRWRQRLADGGVGVVVERWRALSPSSRGEPVSWEAAGTGCRGVTAGVDESGALLVARGGRTERIVGGEIRWES